MMNIVTRSQWGAHPPKARYTITAGGATEGVFVHYTSSPYDTQADHAKCAGRVKAVQEFHQGPSRGWSDIAYSFLVCQHGTVFEGRGFGVQGAHTLGYNSRAHAVCFLGGDRDGRDDVTDRGRAALGWIVRELLRRYPEGGGKVRGHRDVNQTACPGDELYAWVRERGWKLDDGDGAVDAGGFWRGFWRWNRWQNEGKPKPRPAGIRRRIPREWWERRKKLLAARDENGTEARRP